ncbi:5-hydroxytryptamine receptor 1D-like [Tubulanus polymorphus]|uniref:5-hydroxytryptamine receptor 1D-like n=1 Tax=Tubulanus polymorphus TaxID=672921 RepID=UPI003DA6C370
MENSSIITPRVNLTEQARICSVTWVSILIGVVLALITIATIVGNTVVLVITVVVKEMRTMSNVMIASLATADLLVSTVVLPFSTLHQICDHVWILGVPACKFWVAADVAGCSASILNIVAIAIDRYFTIAYPVIYTNYADRCFYRKRVCGAMLFLVWFTSVIIAVAPHVFDWYAGTEFNDPTTCILSQDEGYILFASVGVFFIPEIIVLVLYARIWRIAITRLTLRRRKVIPNATTSGSQSEYQSRQIGAAPSNDADVNQPIDKRVERAHVPNTAVAGSVALNKPPGGAVNLRNSAPLGGVMNKNPPGDVVVVKKASHERTRRATILLGVIIAVFTTCWVPYFLCMIIITFCASCAATLPPAMFDTFVWFGYVNSLLNPFIYAIFSRDFKTALEKLKNRFRN